MRLALDNPFSVAAFKTTLEGRAAWRVVEAHADEIICAAEAGDPPLSVVAPFLEGVIVERLHWKLCDKMIHDFLGSDFVQIGRILVSRGMPYYRACYARITIHG